MVSQKEEFEKDVEQKIREARKCLRKASFPFSLFTCYDPHRAADLYTEAGDLYLALDNYIDAAKSFIKSAEICRIINDLGSKSQAAQCYMKAAEVYSLKEFLHPSEAIECYVNSSVYYAASGNLSIAATRRLNAADICLNGFDYEKAEEHLEKATQYYEKARMPASGILVLDKYIRVLLKNRNYKVAGEKILELGMARSNKEFHMMCAFLCSYLSGDQENMENIYMTFPNSEEKTIIEAFYVDENKDSIFEERIEKYFRVNPVKEEIKDLIDIVKNRIKPEFDIL